ncbi:uncharacterized protein [Diabrotica undecimpunctata]|uniref:uncharacterized protein n=1 Tax=Diabrotica undecimpunctata TaxID=50387 RepID=UPI003B63F26D
MNQEKYACLIDFEKAFDRMQHSWLKEIWLNNNMDSKDVMNDMMSRQNELTEDIQIRRGVRQVCIISPSLFNLYSEAILAIALAEVNRGLIIKAESLNIMRYAADTVLLKGTLEKLQHLA